MPELSSGQFQPRLFDPGPALHGPRRGEGVPVGEATAVPPSHAAGQVAMNLDDPNSPSADSRRITGRGGLTPVTQESDPNWSARGFDIGGARRDSPFYAEKWESLPVETIPPGAEIRSGQVSSHRVGIGKQDDDSGRAFRKHGSGREAYRSMTTPHVEEHYVDKLKGSTKFSNDQYPSGAYMHKGGDDTPRWPWVIETQTNDATQRYVVEGTHRTAAMRERGTGEVQAHVMRGKPGQHVDDVVDAVNEEQYEEIRRKKAERAAADPGVFQGDWL